MSRPSYSGSAAGVCCTPNCAALGSGSLTVTFSSILACCVTAGGFPYIVNLVPNGVYIVPFNGSFWTLTVTNNLTFTDYNNGGTTCTGTPSGTELMSTRIVLTCLEGIIGLSLSAFNGRTGTTFFSGSSIITGASTTILNTTACDGGSGGTSGSATVAP